MFKIRIRIRRPLYIISLVVLAIALFLPLRFYRGQGDNYSWIAILESKTCSIETIALELNDGYLLLSNDFICDAPPDVLIFKLTRDGRLAWSRILASSLVTCSMSFGNLALLIGIDVADACFFLKLDERGEVLEKEYFVFTDGSKEYSIRWTGITRARGGYALIGLAHPLYKVDEASLALSMLDEGCNILWVKIYRGNLTELAQETLPRSSPKIYFLEDGFLLLSSLVMRTDLQGEPKWSIMPVLKEFEVWSPIGYRYDEGIPLSFDKLVVHEGKYYLISSMFFLRVGGRAQG
ncbi:MAG: hypothetical protein DRO00_04335 [Thermoproteota archaeon]|nr:MAG: hypothetical protein DRO00_04335 [Candidatus Korarchaeota archaeon]